MYTENFFCLSICSDRWTCSTTGSEPICKLDPGRRYHLEVFRKEGI